MTTAALALPGLFSHNEAVSKNSGFTLVELLVVIFIIGVLAGLLLTNFVGMRGRATDARTKNDLRQLKTALRLYYNDYNGYPSGDGTILGCGAAGDTECTVAGTFSAGSDSTVYMKQLPAAFFYYSAGGDDFILIGELENVSDEDISASQTRCDPNSRGYYTDGPIDTNEYVVCED